MAIHGARFLNTESDNMAGSDKKEQQLATGQTPSGGATPLDVQPPDVRHIVIDGAASGLIPRATLDTDQTITLAAWFGSNPPDGETDKFRLQIARKGSNEWETLLPERTYTGGLYASARPKPGPRKSLV